MATDVVWYLALVDSGSVEFDPDVHSVMDMLMLSFTFEHAESGFASLRITTENPLGEDGTFALGLLRPGQKQWAWFSASFDDGEAEPLMLGRIVTIPTDVFGKIMTVEFQARPEDFVAQKEVLAEAIRAEGPPLWCEEFYDEQQRGDPELVLEAISGLWYIDPVTHEVSVDDILIGQGDALSFGLTDHLFDGMSMNLAGVPTPAVDVDVEISWTLRASGTVPLTLSSSSHTLSADAYPKAGASFGEGWVVQSATVTQSHDFAVKSVQRSSELIVDWWDGAKTSVQTQTSDDEVSSRRLVPDQDLGIPLPRILTNYTTNSSYSEGILTSWTVQEDSVSGLVPAFHVTGEYVVSYDAARPMVERVTYTLRADVQTTIVPPDDAERPRLDFKTVDLSEPIDGVAPIGDPRSRSFVCTEEGQRRLFYTLLCATAKLKMDSRAVEITFSPLLSRITELRLDKNATLQDWRLPGGTATGKITKFALSLAPPAPGGGGSSTVDLKVTMACAVGRGGTLVEVGGEPDYIDDDYIDEAYQERTGEVILFDDEVGLTPPHFDPSDDGLDFTSVLTASDIFEVPVSHSVTIQEQAAAVLSTNLNRSQFTGGGPSSGLPPPTGFDSWSEAMQAAVEARNEAITKALDAVPHRMTFKLRDVRAKFERAIPLVVQDPKIPKMIDLEYEEP